MHWEKKIDQLPNAFIVRKNVSVYYKLQFLSGSLISASFLIVVLLLLEFCRIAENLYFKGSLIVQIVTFSDCSGVHSWVSDGWYFNASSVWDLFVFGFAMHLLTNICRTPKKTNLLHVISAGGESASSSHVRPPGVSSAVPASSPFRPVWVSAATCLVFSL